MQRLDSGSRTYHQACSSLDSMARRLSRAQLPHTQTDPRRGSVSSIQVSGGSATLVPHIEQLVPVESGAVICGTIVALSANKANAKAPGSDMCRNPGPLAGVQ